MVRLSKTEKDEIAKLYKCQRAAEENEIHEQLNQEITELTKDIDERINALKAECEELKNLKSLKVKEAGYGTFDRNGCMKSHARIDAFKLETNAQLMKLWSGEVNLL